MFPYIIQGDNVIIVVDGKPHTVNKTHITYDKLKQAIVADDMDSVRELVEPKKIIVNYAQGNVSILGSEFQWKGKPMHTALSTKMIDMLREGFPIEPLANFMHNLMDNPSKQAVEELYGFLEKGALPITPDGHFLAYKKVREDYMDCHTGTISNRVGAVVEMPRNEVDDKRDNTCSSGLHFCSQEYLQSFSGARTVILKINPRDVVSIPTDYNNSKGRTCRYEVISELDVPESDAFTRPVQASANVVVKTGSSAFYAGYTAGFQGVYNNEDAYIGHNHVAYTEGYNKGSRDRWTGVERYRYIAPEKSTTKWPFPKTGPVGY